MATLNVSLPDDVIARLKEQLEPHGYTVEQFATSSLASFADAGQLITPELEAKLLAALDMPLLDAQEVDFDAKVRRLEATRGQGK